MQKYIQTTDNNGPNERSKDIGKGIKDVKGNGNTEDNPFNEDTSDVSNNLSNIKVLNPRGYNRNVTTDKITGGGRPRKNPNEYDYLLKGFLMV